MKDKLPKPAKPTLDTPDTLILGVYSDGATAGIAGVMRDRYGTLLADILEGSGRPWAALHAALDTAKVLIPSNVLIFSNDAVLVAALTPPFRPPPPAATQRHWFGKGDFIDAQYGGDADHWACLAELGGTYGGRFGAMKVDDLKRAKEIWQQLNQ
jgi:hypothetical protein